LAIALLPLTSDGYFDDTFDDELDDEFVFVLGAGLGLLAGEEVAGADFDDESEDVFSDETPDALDVELGDESAVEADFTPPSGCFT
jgi:hypothetical protein